MLTFLSCVLLFVLAAFALLAGFIVLLPVFSIFTDQMRSISAFMRVALRPFPFFAVPRVKQY